MIKVLIVSVLLFSTIVFGSNVNEKRTLKIAHFYSNSVGFWPMSIAFANAASKDLNIEYNSYLYDSSPVTLIQVVKDVLNNPDTRPDGFIFHNYKGRGELILEIANKAKVPAVMFNSGPKKDDKFGNPREKYPYYLGLITPDDEKAGYDLAKELIHQAKEKNLYGDDGKIHFSVLEGSRTSGAAILRKKGLIRALNENKDVVVDQFFDTKWKKGNAQNAFELSILRYKNVKIFWTASDLMALGVLDGAKKIHKQPGVDFIVGGIDLLPTIQPAVLDGSIAVSIGAHYTESVWAIILLSDYLRGYDFAKEIEIPIFKSRMMTLRSSDKSLLPGNSKEEVMKWAKKIDFSKYSKSISKSSYDFDANLFFK